jgi:hypothetical protein
LWEIPQEQPHNQHAVDGKSERNPEDPAFLFILDYVEVLFVVGHVNSL